MSNVADILLLLIIVTFWVAVLLAAGTAVYIANRYRLTAGLLAIYALIIAIFTVQYMRLTTDTLPLPRITNAETIRIMFLSLAITAAMFPIIALYATNEHTRRTDSEAEIMSRKIKELEALENARQEIDRQFDEQSAILSHELNTPLSAIVGYSDMMRKEEIPESLLPIAEGIYRGTSRLRVIAGFYDAMIRRVHIEPFDINAAIRESLDHRKYELWAGTRHYPGDVTIVTPEQPLLIEGDEKKLTTAVMELIRNALKASDKGQVVGVGGRQINGNFVISVRDDGVGVAREQHGQIFNQGEQLYERVNDRPNEGSGLGLFVVSRVVEEHGGAVYIDSDPGAGAVFWISLPRYHT